MSSTSGAHRSAVVLNVSTHTADVYIGRGSPFGNPFVMRDRSDEERKRVIQAFREWIKCQPELLRLVRRSLHGKTLGCHCAPQECHGDVLAEIARGEWDDRIPLEPVMTFWSDLAGRHGRGAALFAKRNLGADESVTRGPSGSSYAIPAKDDRLRPLPLEQIHEEVQAFIRHARAHPEIPFQVARSGRGLMSYSDEQVAALFAGAPMNVDLPGVWRRALAPESTPIQVIIAGGRSFTDWTRLQSKLTHLLGNHPDATVVSGGARGADSLGERFAVQHGLRLRRLPAEWDRFGKKAGPNRNHAMARLATHLVAFWDGHSRGTHHMIDTADRCGLEIRVVRIDGG
ncbi:MULTISPECIES: DUF4326 domain-containing protein [unclassified Thioalkalivibrio]|uniref:A1S_2505 family phage non-structural protein n=1 Tax=unclassified Thioalkalivibrio TaxID=2621013 RepID=UPI00036EB293|nr:MULTISPECIES: DUF4326 domain-containing protein [unclassified Thioalkalivibrio]